jgi:hypothetical protein
VRLKNRLGDIQPDYANLLHGRLHQVVLLIPLLWHTDAAWGRPPHQKSGCKAEDSRLRTADRLANLMTVFCILSWRVFWLTMLNRAAPNAAPTMALTAAEIDLLDKFVADVGSRRCRPGTLSFYLTKLARLGGYLARTSDPPPGNTVMWRGLSRLTDIGIGADIGAAENVGN